MKRSRRRLALLAAAFVPVFTLAACGESEAEKAKAQVCHSRSEIEKSVASLKNLPLSTDAFSTAKDDFESILAELKKISEAEPKLEPSIRGKVESAQSEFKSTVLSITGELATGIATSGSASKKLSDAVKKLGESYKKTLASIDCP
ncbi:MAG TPA: hypothetical protein VMA83_04845 [Solirubrobacteraceae bacterium]|nr:hypothetical protein [Solirubrobacteraceae bacterium]